MSGYLRNISREQLGYEPFFEHPAFPGKKNFSESIILGLPPEKKQEKEEIVNTNN
jgi:hypothetical protein